VSARVRFANLKFRPLRPPLALAPAPSRPVTGRPQASSIVLVVLLCTTTRRRHHGVGAAGAASVARPTGRRDRTFGRARHGPVTAREKTRDGSPIGDRGYRRPGFLWWGGGTHDLGGPQQRARTTTSGGASRVRPPSARPDVGAPDERRYQRCRESAGAIVAHFRPIEEDQRCTPWRRGCWPCWRS
jgi:hypothetical protein